MAAKVGGDEPWILTGGRYPVAMTDLQGPLDTAYLVWESSAFMLAMYTNPKEVHHLMRVVTDLIIRYVKPQRGRSPEFLPSPMGAVSPSATTAWP